MTQTLMGVFYILINSPVMPPSLTDKKGGWGSGLHHPLAWFSASVRFKQIDFFVTGAGGQHHAFAHAELHLARLEVGDNNGQLANQVFRGVGAFDAGKHIAGFAAQIQRQAQQLV